jgi:4-hydroxythreonine-4-phosphate dehydrogenase
MTASDKPRIAVTMGDPAGVGPEVIVAAWADRSIHARVFPLVLGHPEILRRAAKLLHSTIEVCEVDRESVLQGCWKADAQTLSCLRTSDEGVLDLPTGRVDARAGEAAYQAVREAIKLAIEGHVDAIVTAPLSKAALHAAGHHYPGHTELLAESCGISDFAMMLYLPPGAAIRGRHGLGVIHVTLHQSLRTVFSDLNVGVIEAKCQLAHNAMRALGVERPRIAVAALNPHAGEDGLFGDEERTIISPAVGAARAAGLDASGPFPTDTLMVRARDGEFDAVVAMYHDQGHIALKLLGMHAAVNVTLGLPIIRTSVAHGTAFDRAWQGTAESAGMMAALLTAGQLASNHQRC